MKKILVVEDSPIVTKIIRHVMKCSVDFEAYYADSLAATMILVEQHKGEFFTALVDLNLPDAPDGEVVDCTLAEKIPTIVLTGSYDDERREALLDKGIVDYVLKEGRYSYDYAVNLIGRLKKNCQIKVLVVEDSDTSRKFISSLLQRQLFHVLEAKDGIEAIKVVVENPDIKLLITDYNMPKMDGFELVKNLRHKYDKSDLIIIGLSAEGKGTLSAKFIKHGANDFLQKPFYHEEFNCRVQHNVESLELVERITYAANCDYLTGTFNRRYFFNIGAEMYAHAKNNHSLLAAVVIDLDNFKRINDSYGHDAGDNVLKVVAGVLKESFSRFLVARTGGEEFFALLPGLDNEKAMSFVSKIRQIVSITPIPFGDEDIFITISSGVTNQFFESLDEMINKADEFLYRAKEAGRNIVVGDDDDVEDSD